MGLAGLLLLSLLVPAIQEALSLNTVSGLQIFSAVLAGMVLADRQLAKLSFAEVSREVAGVDIEEATKKFWKEEQQRQREEGRK